MTVALPAAPAARRPAVTRAALVEVGALFALFMVWQLFVVLCDSHSSGSVAHARALYGVERWLHLPAESSVQRPFLGTRALGVLSAWYLWVHWLATPAVFMVLWLRRREAYRRWRAVLVGSTLLCFLVQLWTVAPPRLAIPGVFDPGATSAGGGSALVAADVAFPSLHVAWALCVGLALYSVLSGAWRGAAVGYTAVTVLAVIVTGNHYWLDCVASGLVVALVAVGRCRWESRQ